MCFFSRVFTVRPGLSNLPNSSAFSIIDACMLLFYLQLGGCKSVVGLWKVIHRYHACTHTPTSAHATYFTLTIRLHLLPAALLNWRISGSEMKLVNLDCFYDWLDMICIIIWTQCSFSLCFCLPPVYSLPPSHPFHYLDWLKKKKAWSLYNTCIRMYADIQSQRLLDSLWSQCM